MTRRLGAGPHDLNRAHAGHGHIDPINKAAEDKMKRMIAKHAFVGYKCGIVTCRNRDTNLIQARRRIINADSDRLKADRQTTWDSGRNTKIMKLDVYGGGTDRGQLKSSGAKTGILFSPIR